MTDPQSSLNQPDQSVSESADDFLEVGRIADPYGVKGWINVIPFSNEPVALLKAKTWWVKKPIKSLDQKGALTYGAAVEFMVAHKKEHADRVVAQFMGFEDRTAAESLKGAVVFLPRSAFPKTAEDEYYWVDLVGCAVRNRQDQDLGIVAEVVDHGAHPILVITPDGLLGHKPDVEVLVPFVSHFIDQVDIVARHIRVDWEHDFN